MTDIDVKALRIKLGLSRAELAQKLDVDTCTIHRWEDGKARIHRVNQKRLERLARKACPI